jgi:hypothetical protein
MKDLAALHIRLILRKDRHEYEHSLFPLICFGAGLDAMESDDNASITRSNNN